MAGKTLSANEQIIDLLQKLIIIELAKQGVPQNDIARFIGIQTAKVNAALKFFNVKKK